MASQSIDQDPNFRYLDQSTSKELGHVECYENKMSGEIVAKKTIPLGKLFSNTHDVAIFNTVLSYQPQELSPVSSNYQGLGQQSSYPQFLPEKEASLYFLDSPVTLDGVSQF